MQLTLSSPPFAKPSVVTPPVPKTPRFHDSGGLAQLDQIAAQNPQGSRQGLGASAMLLALVGGLVVLGSASMWNGSADEARKPAAAVAGARSVPKAPATVSKAAEAVPAVAPAGPESMVAMSVAPSMPFIPGSAVASAAPAELVAAADDAARKARAKQIADARRKAAQASQQQALVEESERLQLAQQREAEGEQQQRQLAEQARQRAAVEQARLDSVQLAVNTRRSVAESCAAAGGFVGQQFCRTRECGKPEHQGDAVCLRLRDNELAQQRASNER
jgi:Skp family chaperone for outer membrane proteins